MAHLRKCVEHGVWLVLLQGVAQPGKDQHSHAHRHAQQQKLSVNIILNISELFMEMQYFSMLNPERENSCVA